MPQRYFIRAVKSAISFFTIAILIIALVYVISDGQEKIPFGEFIHKGNNFTWMAIFLVIFGFVYPFIGYAKNNIPLNDAFSDNDKTIIVAIFNNARFVLTHDDGQTLKFHHKNAITKFMRLYEDTIIVDYSTNTLFIEGLRRDTDRLARAIAWKLKEQEEENN